MKVHEFKANIPNIISWERVPTYQREKNSINVLSSTIFRKLIIEFLPNFLW